LSGQHGTGKSMSRELKSLLLFLFGGAALEFHESNRACLISSWTAAAGVGIQTFPIVFNYNSSRTGTSKKNN